MSIDTTSTHKASLTVPVSGNPADRIEVSESADRRAVTFEVTSAVSADDASRKLRDFFQAARDAAQA